MTPCELADVLVRLIDDFRMTEDREGLVYLTPANPGLQKVFASWSELVVSVPQERLEQYAAEFPTAQAAAIQWHWMWEHVVQIEFEILATITGLSASQVKAIVPILAGNRLIYPDGGVHKEGRVIVTAQAIQAASPRKRR